MKEMGSVLRWIDGRPEGEWPLAFCECPGCAQSTTLPTGQGPKPRVSIYALFGCFSPNCTPTKRRRSYPLPVSHWVSALRETAQKPIICSFLVILLLLSGCGKEQSAVEWHAQAQELVGKKELRQLDLQTLAQAEFAEQRALALDSTLIDAAWELAALYEARGAYEDASALYRKLVEAHPNMGRAYAGLGFSLAAQGRYSGAMRAYQDALRRGERSALIYARLGHSYQALGHVEDHLRSARASYRAALQLDANIADVHRHLAKVEVRLEQHQEALRSYRQALEVDSGDTEARVELAALYRQLGQAQVGRGILATGLAESGTETALLHQELGRLLWQDGDAERALEHFSRALALDDNGDLSRRYMGLIYSAQGQYKKALEAFLTLAKTRPLDSALQINIGIVHSQMGDLKAAEVAFKKALGLGGDGGDAAIKLGGLYMHQQRLRAAVKVFKDATKAHKENAELHAALGDVYRQLGVLGTALGAGQEAVRLEPQRALWRYHLAATYEQLDPDRARVEWVRYAELAQGDARETQRLRAVEEILQEEK